MGKQWIDARVIIDSKKIPCEAPTEVNFTRVYVSFIVQHPYHNKDGYRSLTDDNKMSEKTAAIEQVFLIFL